MSIRQSLTAELQIPILGSLTQTFDKPLSHQKGEALLDEEPNKGSVSKNKNTVSGQLIITKLSYTHLVELIRISDGLKRTFYEIETIKGRDGEWVLF